MKDFEEVLFRLKRELGVKTDKKVAELLGMSNKAFADRKLRDSFPTDKLLALKAKRPELSLDDIYILTGERLSRPEQEKVQLMLETTSKVDPDGSEHISQLALDAAKKVGKQARRNNMHKLLDLVSDEDLAIIEQLLERLTKK